jgi:hypothetical protein
MDIRKLAMLNVSATRRLLQWFVSGDTGISSICIVATIMDLDIAKRYQDTPMDPIDFSRCLRLLKAVPELREHLYLMVDVSEEWDKFMLHWAELEATFMDEVPQWMDGKFTGRATETYRKMRMFRGEDV